MMGDLSAVRGADLGAQAWVPRGDDPPAAARFRPVRNRPFPWVKPEHDGGLWTSTWQPGTGSGWIQWCIEESFDCDCDSPTFPVWKLTPDPAARVARIDSLADLEALVAAYPAADPEWRAAGRFEHHPDWQRIADDFDAVNLTDAGQWATRLTDPGLYGWDCESTLWLRWAFTAVEDLGRVTFEACEEAAA